MIKLDCGAYFAYEQIGRFSLTEEWRHPRRIIKSHELIVVLEGTLYINEGGVFYELKKGDAIILEPGLLHYGTRSVSEPVSFFWLHFRTDLPMPFKTAVGQELHDLNYILRKLLHAEGTKSYSKDELDALAYAAFIEAKYVVPRDLKQPSRLVELAKELVRGGIEDGISVSDIAARLGYNKEYIGRVFQAYTGQSLKEYIAVKRIAYAKSLLLTTDMSIKQVSAALGYAEENTFIKFFLYHEGMSPGRFKNQYFATHLNNK